jgi:putative membrane protein
MSDDSVTKIHKRFYLTLLSPESHFTSLLISFVCASLVIVLSYIYYLDLPLQNLVVILPLSLAVLYAAMMIDFVILKHLPVAKLSKIHHSNAFANLLWLATIFFGIMAAYILGKPEEHFRFIVEGMMLAAAFRIVVFRSVFGASLPKAILVSPVLPLIFFVSFMPIQQVPFYLSDAVGLSFGISLVALAAIWAMVADRAGRPGVVSTFKLLQAYLLAMTEQNPKSIERMIEDKAQESKVSTYTLAFKTSRGRSAIVVPDIHPGPFYPVGGSNLPYEIYKTYSQNSVQTVVMHSISDHSLNLPSRAEVENYLNSLSDLQPFESSNTCTEPIVIQVNKARVSGLAFNKVALLMLSLSPHGMEDVPELIRKEVESYTRSKGFSHVLLVDSHNSMGKHLSEDDSLDLLKACKVALDELVKKPQNHFKLGFCHSSEIGASASDVGPAGMSVMVINVNDKSFAICWADSNNMARGLREHVFEQLAAINISILEICTSDTHYTSGNARNLTGYFTFGSLSSPSMVSKWYLEMAKKAGEKVENASYDVSQTSSDVKVMGSEQFLDYSKALDRALNVTKVFVGITVAVYIAMLVM